MYVSTIQVAKFWRIHILGDFYQRRGCLDISPMFADPDDFLHCEIWILNVFHHMSTIHKIDGLVLKGQAFLVNVDARVMFDGLVAADKEGGRLKGYGSWSDLQHRVIGVGWLPAMIDDKLGDFWDGGPMAAEGSYRGGGEVFTTHDTVLY